MSIIVKCLYNCPRWNHPCSRAKLTKNIDFPIQAYLSDVGECMLKNSKWVPATQNLPLNWCMSIELVYHFGIVTVCPCKTKSKKCQYAETKLYVSSGTSTASYYSTGVNKLKLLTDVIGSVRGLIALAHTNSLPHHMMHMHSISGSDVKQHTKVAPTKMKPK